MEKQCNAPGPVSFHPPEELQTARLDSCGPGREPGRGDSPGPELSPPGSVAQKPGPEVESPPTVHPSSSFNFSRPETETG